MSGRRGQVHLGDLVRAIVALEAHEVAEAAEIARVLGLVGAEGADGATRAAPAVAGPVAGPPEAGDAGEVEQAEHGEGEVDFADAAVVLPRPLPELADGNCSVIPLRGPVSAAGVDALERLGPADVARLLDGGAEDAAAPVPASPWVDRWAPGVMFAAASTDVVSRTVDERALVRRLADRSFLRELPRRERPTTRRGIQLVLDGGESMQPFRADQRLLRELAGGVVGRDRVEVVRFRGTPLRGVRRAGRRAWVTYRAPAAARRWSWFRIWACAGCRSAATRRPVSPSGRAGSTRCGGPGVRWCV